jgi:hypothetical protein
MKENIERIRINQEKGQTELQSNLYIDSVAALADELQKRREKAKTIRQALDGWFRDDYGIENFSSLLDSFWGSQDYNSKIVLVLSRQIATGNLRSLALSLSAQFLCQQGIPSYVLEFSYIRDIYLSRNELKRSYLNIPVASTMPGGGLEIRERGVPITDSDDLESKPLCQIVIDRKALCQELEQEKQGKKPPFFTYFVSDEVIVSEPSLVMLHSALRSRIFNSAPPAVKDVSEFFQKCLAENVRSGKVPTDTKCFILKEGKEICVTADKLTYDDILRWQARPGSKWYYREVPVYLAMFVDGCGVLVENFDDAGHFEKLVVETMQIFEQKVGIKPLIAKIPLQNELDTILVPNKFLENPALLNNLLLSSNTPIDSFYELYRQSLEKVETEIKRM